MENEIYFIVKVLCAVFMLYQLWIFIFSRKMYDGWDKVYRMMVSPVSSYGDIGKVPEEES